MKICLVDTGITSSTADVYRGLLGAFERAGHEIVQYHLAARIRQADYMLDRAWKDHGKPADHRPTKADVYYRPAEGIHCCVLRNETPEVIVVTAQVFHPDHLVFLQRIGVTVGIVCTESPYGDQFQSHFLQATDCGWTQERASVERLRQTNPNVWYLPAAYDPGVHTTEATPGDDEVEAHDVVLVATAFAERVALLSRVNGGGINQGLLGAGTPVTKPNPHRRVVRDGIIDNHRAASLYRRAKIGLNLYRDGLVLAGQPGAYLTYAGAETVAAESLNPRALELAACGTFQISQHRAEVDEVFRSSVPTFRDPDELEALIRGFLGWDAARRELAEEARIRAEGWSFDTRVQSIVADIQSIRAPAEAAAALA